MYEAAWERVLQQEFETKWSVRGKMSDYHGSVADHQIIINFVVALYIRMYVIPKQSHGGERGRDGWNTA